MMNQDIFLNKKMDGWVNGWKDSGVTEWCWFACKWDAANMVT